jgi:hypothetical protein
MARVISGAVCQHIIPLTPAAADHLQNHKLSGVGAHLTPFVHSAKDISLWHQRSLEQAMTPQHSDLLITNLRMAETRIWLSNGKKSIRSTGGEEPAQ